MKYKEFKRWSLISLSVDLIFSAVRGTANRNSLQIFRHWTKDNMADFCEPLLLSSVQERTQRIIFIHNLLYCLFFYCNYSSHFACFITKVCQTWRSHSSYCGARAQMPVSVLEEDKQTISSAVCTSFTKHRQLPKHLTIHPRMMPHNPALLRTSQRKDRPYLALS